jgi:hypothetical protein
MAKWIEVNYYCYIIREEGEYKEGLLNGKGKRVKENG